MPFAYIFDQVWRWFADTGINIVLLILLALLVPRAGRFANRRVERRVRETGEVEEGKSQLAVTGVVVYIVQMIAYFLIFVFLLQQLGFSLAGAAIPATVASAAVGFGAQNIIADFLAGFFILSEKQYGVGDYVEFQGNGVDVAGDVIQITMRATTIRTLNQATVTIPNSAARLYINQSNYWVNALVVMPVPLAGSNSADEAIGRAERAVRRAISRPDIHEKLLGQLIVHPAVEVNPPTAAGLPWTVDMRFMVRVEPLSQWMVERAIRAGILDEFWQEYGHTFPPIEPKAEDTHPPTELMAPVRAARTAGAASAAGVAAPKDEAEGDVVVEGGVDKQEAPKLMRTSTAWLLVGFTAALLVRGLTVTPGEDSDADSGVLAPPRATATSTATETATATVTVTQEPAPSTAAETVTGTIGTGSPAAGTTAGTGEPVPAPRGVLD